MAEPTTNSKTVSWWGCEYKAENPPSKGKALGFVLLIIGGLFCFGLLAGALRGSFDHLTHLNVRSFVVIGGGGGIVLMVFGIVGLSQETCYKSLTCQCSPNNSTEIESKAS